MTDFVNEEARPGHDISVVEHLEDVGPVSAPSRVREELSLELGIVDPPFVVDVIELGLR